MSDVEQKVLNAIASLLPDRKGPILEDTPLIGDGSLLDSMKLVELCLVLEDLAAQDGFEFDWTSETAMSRSRSMFRNARSLAAEFRAQMNSKK